MLIEERDQTRCWVPVPQRSYTDLYQLIPRLYMLPSTPSNEISELCTTQEHFSSCRIICAGPNPTDFKGSLLNSSKGCYGLPMSVSSPIIYGTSPSYQWVTGFTLLGTVLIIFPIRAWTEVVKVKWVDAKCNWRHQIYAVQVWGGQQGEFRHMAWNLSDQWPGAVVCTLRVKLCLAITQQPLQMIMTCLK